MNTMPNDEPTPAPARRRSFVLAAVGLALVSALAGTGLARLLRRPEPPAPPPPFPGRLFRGWERPDLALVLSAQQHGYLLPCGCSRPQYGGLERRYNFLQILKQRGWPVVALDLGDVPQQHGPAKLPNVQGLLKYRYSMQALKEMGYTAVGAGEHEVALDLLQILGQWALNEPVPAVLAANLLNRENQFPGLKDLEITPEGAPFRVGAVSVIGKAAAARIQTHDNALRFAPNPGVLKEALAKMAGKVDLPVLLYHGLSRDRKGKPDEAVFCAEAFPQFPVVLCLNEEEEPPASPTVVNHPGGGRSLVVSLGHKGRYVGVVGVYRTGKKDQPYTFRYQLVELGEEFVTPEGKEKGHSIVELMEKYTAELKADNYLSRYGQSKHLLQVMAPVAAKPGEKPLKGSAEPTYVGSQKCKKCHASAYEVWQKSGHSHAYQTLADARRPSNRQYDPECIVCHVTGFGYKGGFTEAERTPLLKDVGCESCHGPASVHVANPTSSEWQARLNPWKAAENEAPKDKARRIDRIDMFCQRCHDTDNDVTWSHAGFPKKWPKIAHPTLPPE